MSSLDESYNRPSCPYLGSLDSESVREEFVDYPSFENHCFVGPNPEPILLTDQATFCLSSGFKHCPLYQPEPTTVDSTSTYGAATRVGASATSKFAAGADPMLHAIAEMEESIQEQANARRRQRRRWGWIGALTLFVSSLVCGGTFAAYLGWRLVNNDSQIAQAGTITQLSAPATQAPPALYLVVTATSEAGPQAIPPPAQNAAQQQNSVDPASFPAAVTATPQPSSGQPIASNSPHMSSAAEPLPQVDGPAMESSAPDVYDGSVQIPTRRPTPILDLAVSIPTNMPPTDTPLPSPTPIPLGTPVVLFAAEDEELLSGKCTMISWNVENVNAVYYENIGVDGHGEKKECVKDKPGEYTLTIVLPNGSTEIYTTTVGVIFPTSTPVPTATFRPTVEPSPTWTPIIPTDTPTPDMHYQVLLTKAGGNDQECTAGDTCRVELRATNGSIGVDNLSITIVKVGKWPSRLCRLDGVCADTTLQILNVGPSNTALIELQVDVEDGAAGNSSEYIVRAASDGSGGSAQSESLSIIVQAK